jgi:uncharacterized short protein YbdD (DUF466 family)
MRIDRRLAAPLSNLVRIVRALTGVPDYAAYLAHWRVHHPDREPLDRAAFVREREAARYGRGRSRCC